MKRLLLGMLVVGWMGPVWAAPDNTMSITPSATAGTTITASDENTRNSNISTTFNAHGHTDISQVANTLNVGDGTAGNKQICGNAADTTDSCIRWDDTANLWVVDHPTVSSFNQIATISGTAGLTGRAMALGDGTGSLVTGPTVPSATAPTTFGDFSVRAFNSGGLSLTSGTAAVLTMNSERWDTDTMHSTSSNTGRLTATTAGKYFISAHVVFDQIDNRPDEAGHHRLDILLNGTTVIASTYNHPVITTGTALSVATHYDLSAADFVEMRAFQNGVSTLNVLHIANHSPEMAMVKAP